MSNLYSTIQKPAYTGTLDNNSNITDLIQRSEFNRLVNPAIIADLKNPYHFRAVIYLRVSTPGQAKKEKVSLQEQEEQCLEMIKSNNWEYVGIYHDDGITGTKTECRDSYLKMLEDAGQGLFDIVVCWDFDRLARSHVDLINLQTDLRKKYKVQLTSKNMPFEIEDPRLICISENNMSKDIISAVMGIVAEQENKKRVNRMNMGKYGKAKKGMIPCKAPYGYKIKYEFINNSREKKREWVEVEPDEASIVKDIYNHYDNDGWGIRRIAEHLNFENKKPPISDRWGYTSIRYILQNPTYAKWVRYGWRLSKSKDSIERLKGGHQGIIEEGGHPEIIDRQQFLRVRNKLRIKAKLGGRAAVSKGLLTGVIKCGRCGGGAFLTTWPHWLAYRKSKEQRGAYKRVRVYICSNYTHFGRAGCTKRYVMSAGKIEKIVLNKIRKLAKDETAQKEFIAQMKKSRSGEINKEIVGVKASLDKLAKKKERIKNIFVDGSIDPSEFTELLKQIEKDIQKENLNLDRLNEDLHNQEKVEQQTKEAIMALYDFDSIWESASFEKRKELISTILEKVSVEGNMVNITFASMNQ